MGELLGAKVTVVELMDQIIPGADKDIITPLMKRITKQYDAIHLKAKVTKVEANGQSLTVYFEGGSAPASDTFDQILVAVGRRPNGRLIGAENAGVLVDERGFISVDRQMRTNVPHIFAIGDIVGQPMLAHKAVHEGKVAAETAAGRKRVLRCESDPVSSVHRSGGGLGRADRERGESEKYQLRQGSVPVGGERPFPIARPRGGEHQGPVRRGDRADHWLRQWPKTLSRKHGKPLTVLAGDQTSCGR
jgi:NADPH-dependent 2,4-dienoyl-CoA reductase/sulfur reductase-like enzyme